MLIFKEGSEIKKFLMFLVILGLLIFGLSCQKKVKEEKVETKVEEQVPVDTTQVQEAPADTTPAQAQEK